MKNQMKAVICVLCAAVIGAIVIAAGAYANANKTNDEVHMDSKVEVVATAETASAETAEVTSKSANAGFVLADGEFKGSTGIYALGTDTATARDFIAVGIASDFTIREYNENAGYIIYSTDMADYRIANISSNDVPLDAVIELTDSEGKPLISGQKQISKSSAVSVMATNFDVENSEAVKEEVHRICNDAALYDGTMNFEILGKAVNAEQAVNIVATNDVISFGQNDSTVYLTPYSSSLTGAGFADEVEIVDGFTAKAGDYQDSESDLKPYIYNDDKGTVKFVAASEDILKATFNTAEPVIKS